MNRLLRQKYAIAMSSIFNKCAHSMCEIRWSLFNFCKYVTATHFLDIRNWMWRVARFTQMSPLMRKLFCTPYCFTKLLITSTDCIWKISLKLQKLQINTLNSSWIIQITQWVYNIIFIFVIKKYKFNQSIGSLYRLENYGNCWKRKNYPLREINHHWLKESKHTKKQKNQMKTTRWTKRKRLTRKIAI